jgi:hypothetical protein
MLPQVIINFQSRQETTSQTSRPLNSQPIHNEIPNGWSGSFEIERANSVIDDYFARIEAGYYAGIAPDVVTIQETIQEVKGGITQYLYTGVALKLDDTGTREADNPQKQKVGFRASQRLKVA